MIYIPQVHEILGQFSVLEVISIRKLLGQMRSSFLLFAMVKGALVASRTFLLIRFKVGTRLRLINKRVIVLLLPAVTVLAAGHVLASVRVLGYESASAPVVAEVLVIVFKDIWFPPEVLPIVAVNTL